MFYIFKFASHSNIYSFRNLKENLQRLALATWFGGNRLRWVIIIWYDIKNNTAKTSAQFTNISTQDTLIEISKNNKNHQISVLFDVFLDNYWTWNKVTSLHYCDKHICADAMKFCNQCLIGCNPEWVCMKEV